MSTAMALPVMLVLSLLLLGASAREIEILRCKTNSTSPTLLDAGRCVQQVRERRRCCRERGAECTVLATVGSAEATLCSRHPGACIFCDKAAILLDFILRGCAERIQGTRRVAGSTDFFGFTLRMQSASAAPAPAPAGPAPEPSGEAPSPGGPAPEPSGEAPTPGGPAPEAPGPGGPDAEPAGEEFVGENAGLAALALSLFM